MSLYLQILYIPRKGLVDPEGLHVFMHLLIIKEMDGFSCMTVFLLALLLKSITIAPVVMTKLCKMFCISSWILARRCKDYLYIFHLHTDK